jgi:nitroimidazol reductase NimA-like FMN-containing flavoprotein (pyridoxamine 5'-phosphate oxidase superfamily)
MASSYVMSRAEREAFLADVHVGIIAIAEPDRAPLAVPVWYSYEPGGAVEVLMQSDSRKMMAIEVAGRFSLCAQTEDAPYKYVTAEGPVTDVRPYDIATDLLAMATRYLGVEGGAAYVAGAGTGGNGVLVSMTPQHWLSTDYSKQ